MTQETYSFIQSELSKLPHRYNVLGGNRKEAYTRGVLACKSILSDCFKRDKMQDFAQRTAHKMSPDKRYRYAEDYRNGVRDGVALVKRYLYPNLSRKDTTKKSKSN